MVSESYFWRRPSSGDVRTARASFHWNTTSEIPVPPPSISDSDTSRRQWRRSNGYDECRSTVQQHVGDNRGCSKLALLIEYIHAPHAQVGSYSQQPRAG